LSVIKRIASGSLASWMSIFVTLLIQVGLVPLYLKYLGHDIYGLWLVIQSIATLLTILDKSFQNYLGYEFLKFGPKNVTKISKLMSSGIALALVTGFVQLLIVVIFDFYDFSQSLFKNTNLNLVVFEDAETALYLLSFGWLVSGNIGGILTRGLQPFGYYPRMAWWSVVNVLFVNILPAITLFFYPSILVLAISMASSTIILNSFLYIDIFKLFKKVQIKLVTPSFKIAFNSFKLSLVLTVANLFISLRQEGVRLILAPLAGSGGLVSFTTTRTGANVALKGLNTITSPLLPELMGFLRNKDQQRADISYSLIWIILIYLMIPAVLILQFVMPFVFEIWTLGKVEFSPILFALLSLSVLIYATAQPAISINQGSNNLKAQITATAITALVVLLFMYLLIPKIGIIGAGVALVFGEVADIVLYTLSAIKWLKKNNLTWPVKTYFIVVRALVVGSILLFLLVFNFKYNLILFFVFALIYMFYAIKFYNSLPILGKNRINSILDKFLK
jgi:O-antigen/teichoic acid export membrane protein